MSNFDLAIDDYLEDLRVARRCSPHTVSNYARDLKAIARSAANRGIDGWQEITGGDVRSIIAEQHREGIAGRSLARRLSAVSLRKSGARMTVSAIEVWISGST